MCSSYSELTCSWWRFNIIGIGDSVIKNGILSNINGTIIAYGKESLYNSNISNINNLFVSGNESLYYSEIHGIRYLNINGDNVINSSVIYSELEQNATFIALINGMYTYFVFCFLCFVCCVTGVNDKCDLLA